MQVFTHVIDKYGGPLPLTEFLDPRVLTSSELQQRRADAADKQAVERRRQPVSHGLGEDAPAPDKGLGTTTTIISGEHTFLDRKNLYDAVLHDQNFSLVVSFLLAGARVDEQREVDGATPLHVAVAGTTRPLTGLLQRRSHYWQATHMGGGNFSNGGAASAMDAGEEEILDAPCWNPMIISFLLDNGADIDARARVGGETPLMVACATQNVRAVNFLLAKGAQTDVRDFHGRTALNYAVMHPHMMQALLVWMGESAMFTLAQETSLLHQVCRIHGSRFSALYLLEQLGLDVNATENAGGAPRHRAAAHGTAEDADPNGHEQGDDAEVHVPVTAAGSGGGDTPLHCAVEMGDLALVITLLAKGANPSAVNTDTGLTPLDLAIAHLGNDAAGRVLGTDCGGACFAPLRAVLARATVKVTIALVNAIGLSSMDVVSAALWGPVAQAAGMVALLRYCTSAPAPRVATYLAKLENANSAATATVAGGGGSATSLWARVCPSFEWADVSAFQYYIGFLFFFTAPLLLIWLVASFFTSFLVNFAVALVLMWVFFRVKWLDEEAVGCRPLRSFGLWLGLVAAQVWLLATETMLPAIASSDLAEEEASRAPSAVALRLWPFLSAVTAAVLLPVVMLVSPGTVSSSMGARRGIYASLARAKTAPGAAGKHGSGPAANTMAGLPKELIYSIDLPTMVKKPLQAQRCSHTNRVVLRFDHYCGYLASSIGARNHRAYLYLLLSLFSFFCACFYHARAHASDQHLHLQRMAASSVPEALFHTTAQRNLYMHTRVFASMLLLITGYEIYTQLLAIMRGLTHFDLQHAEDESSVYCFLLGDRVYSLFDHGKVANLCGFFLFRDDYGKVQYRVPQMNPHLKAAVEEHQRWQLSGGACGSGCQHDHGGPAAGAAHGHSHDAHQADEGPTHSGRALTEADVEDEAVRERIRLDRAAQQAITTAERKVLGDSSSSAAPPASLSGPVVTSPPLTPAAAATGAVRTDASAASVPGLAQHIFQEMLRNGTDDIVLAQHHHASGQADQTQVEWEEAVEQARSMFKFFQQSMASSTQSALQSMMGVGASEQGEGEEGRKSS